MPAVQKQFEEFHSRIKLDEDDEKANLRGKRETLLKALKNNLENDAPAFEHFNQGSYAMHTGVVPLDGNYDIDVGLLFDCHPNQYPDPVELKKKVYKALNSSGRTVVIRRPCVTVNYMQEGNIAYHVDLAIYAKRNVDVMDLAKGKENTEAHLRVWEQSDPKNLTNLICTRFSTTNELAQYRRCIRYIKRWRDIHFRHGGAPLSIALTVSAMSLFNPRFETSGKPTDLLALLGWVKAMLSSFQDVHTDGDVQQRLQVLLPVTPHNDLMESMTDTQMAMFKEKLENLRNTLSNAYDDELPEMACIRLNKLFGNDFEVPDKAQTAKAVAAPVVSSGNSA